MELKVCALGILFRNEKILLGKRAKHRTSYPNVWDMIGGHSENTETPKQTLIRELQEEIGVTPIQFQHISTLFDANNDHTYHVFIVTDWNGEPECLQPEEHAMIGWFRINEALKLELALPVYRDLFKSLEDN